MKRILGVLILGLAISLSGCGGGHGTKQDIYAKAEKAKTKDEVESALGKADKFDVADLPVLGKVETLTYKGTDGDVVFTFHNGKRQLTTTTPTDKEKK